MRKSVLDATVVSFMMSSSTEKKLFCESPVMWDRNDFASPSNM